MAANVVKWWRKRRESNDFMIASPREVNAEERRAIAAKNCADEAAKAGAKAAAIAFIVVSIPTVVGVRMIPWAKANLNHTAQALIVSAATVATYFIVSDKTILECARVTSYERIQAERIADKRDVYPGRENTLSLAL
ncbi:hypothetical protein KP509_17G017400 [Ceratopteris richardii]|uniref:Early nodulin-93-like n=1 Tax=Ceratopteris richardii TaxID=49495 RepID=A0A8T2SU16_CERRI|nr:hypothetical protein KP509_17G017400 [Ceratopteris richardii]